MRINVQIDRPARRVGIGVTPKGRTGLGPLRSWTRDGRMEIIEELLRLADHSANFASRERARGCILQPATDIQPLVERARPTLRRWHQALLAGEPEAGARRDLVTLHRIVSAAVASAQEELGKHQS